MGEISISKATRPSVEGRKEIKRFFEKGGNLYLFCTNIIRPLPPNEIAFSQ